MATCVVCNNAYDKTFQISMNNQTFTFDCFECAIEKLAPACEHCQYKIIGHGTESKNKIYCCANCAREGGVMEAKDRIN